MATFCKNRIWTCGYDAQSSGLCSDCETKVPQFALWRLMQATLVELSQQSEFPCKPCPTCGEPTRWVVCKDCTETIGLVPNQVIVTQ